MHKSFSKFIAFVLLLVFFQKSCAVLWLHNWLHTNNKATYTTAASNGQHFEHVTCSCLDDFFLPFTQPSEQFTVNAMPAYTGYIEKPFAYFVSSHPLFYCLRAPPAI
jgi:hypothetical protein